MNRINIAAAGLALVATSLIVPAAAFGQGPITVEADKDRVVEYVSYADVDLTSEAGLALLRGRVRGAADRICIHDGVQPLKFSMDGRACYNEAIDGAELQITRVIAALDRGEQFAANSRIAVRGTR